MYARSLFPRDLFAEMDRLQREMQQAFDTGPSIRGLTRGYPALNVGGTPTSVEVFAFAPGLDPATLDVQLEKGTLTIAGERKAPEVPEKATVHIGERFAGRSTWSLWRLWTFAIDGLTAFSDMPLRIWSYVGLLISLVALGFGGLILLNTLISGADVPGYPSLMVAISFFAGVQLITLGVIGEYVGRIFTEVKRRPLFLIAEAHGVEAEGGPAPLALERAPREAGA